MRGKSTSPGSSSGPGSSTCTATCTPLPGSGCRPWTASPPPSTSKPASCRSTGPTPKPPRPDVRCTTAFRRPGAPPGRRCSRTSPPTRASTAASRSSGTRSGNGVRRRRNWPRGFPCSKPNSRRGPSASASSWGARPAPIPASSWPSRTSPRRPACPPTPTSANWSRSTPRSRSTAPWRSPPPRARPAPRCTTARGQPGPRIPPRPGNHPPGHHIRRVLATLDTARREGSRVTVEAYPYGAGSTAVGAAFIEPERLRLKGLKPSSVVILETGERVRDEGRLRQLRQQDPGAPCLLEFLDERDPRDRGLLHQALAFPDAVVASDAMPVYWKDGRTDSTEWPLPPGGTTHPRTAGTFAKTLRLMVRATGAWSWLEAFRRCSSLPSRLLDDVAPGARRKGHLGVGADADLVVLDPARITDAATYTDSTRPSVGVRHLYVAGVPVVSEGNLNT